MKTASITAIIFSTFVFCYSCGTANKDIIIIGYIKNLPSKVYLTDAHNYKQFIDSAICVNDKFIFKIKPEKKFQQLMVSIAYVDRLGKISTLDFHNHILSKPKQNYKINSFILEDDTTLLKGIADVREDVIQGTNIQIHIDNISIQAGQETDAFFSTQMMNFGYLDPDVEKRTTEFNNYISIIQRYPGSEFLLYKIYENKSVVNKEELGLLLRKFDSNILKTDLAKKLQDYLASKVDYPIFENLQLEDSNSNISNIFDSTAKINMLLVWASWCEPCRQEIPEIKKLNILYSKKGLAITSISIDEIKKSWQNALKVENMSWRQLIVPTEKKDYFKTKFEVGSIPYTIFLNSRGKLINRFIGYDKNNISEYIKLIENELH